MGKVNQYREWISKQPCIIHGESCMVYHEDGTYRCAPAHVKAKGMGGKRRPEFDEANLVPLCYPSHAWQHATSWQVVEGVIGRKIEDVARELWDEWTRKN